MGKKKTLRTSEVSVQDNQADKALQRALDDLKQQVASYRSVFEAGSEGYIIHDGGIIVDVNLQFEELTGYKDSDLVGESFLSLVAEESRALVVERMTTRPGRPFEIVGLRKDNSRVHLEVVGKDHVHQGRNCRLISVRDITERKQAEEALRGSEERYRDYYEQAPDAYLSVDPESGLVIECNRTTAEMLGRSEGEIVGQKIFDFYTPASFERVKAALLELQAQGVLHSIELQLRRKDGGIIDVSLDETAVRDELGRVLRSRSVWRDITQRKQAEAALRESEQMFRLVAQGVAEVLWIVDPHEDYKIIYVSPAYEEVWGRTCESLYEDPLSWLAAIHPEDIDRVSDALDEQTATGRFDEEFRVTRPDGSIRWVVDRGFGVSDESGRLKYIVGVADDITEQKEAEEAAQQAREELETKVEEELLRGNPYGITFRELTVLHLVAEGRADKEIANELGIRPHTASRHVKNIMGKMSATSRTDAGVRAVREELID